MLGIFCFYLSEKMPEKPIPTASDIASAHKRIQNFIHRTPILTSSLLNSITGGEIYFKCENFQKMGAFKMRGACNAILQLSPTEKERGVITHSSGNHGQALALAAKLNGIKASVIMPSNAPEVKIEAVKEYGATIIFCEANLQSREQAVKKIQKKEGSVFIHPYNDYRIIAGQATAAKELIEDIPNLNYIICPVGGGGLLSGTALSARYFSPGTKVMGAEPDGADDAFQSFSAGKLIDQNSPDTIADGLLTSLGEKNFDIIIKEVKNIFTASDQEIIHSLKLIMERLKIVIEPSSAVALAVLIKQKQRFSAGKTGIILSGGNIDLKNLASYFSLSS